MTEPVTVGESGVILEFLVNVFGDVYKRVEGAISFTVISISKVVLPPVFVAVTVCFCEIEITTLGVPEIIPVEVSKESPDGSVGLIE